MSDVKGILESLGYKLTEDGAYWRTKPLYRDSDNPSSLRISKSTGSYVDFSLGQNGTLEELVSITMGKPTYEAKEWLNSKQFKRNKIEKEPKIELPQTWNKDILKEFIKNDLYWNNRGISSKTLELFDGGIWSGFKMNQRYTFPIYDYHNHDKIIGFTGRDITNEQKMKWKIIGPKKDFLWPAHINKKIIAEQKEIILVESQGDVLKLWEAGIRNSVCLFGTVCADVIIYLLVGTQPERIIIALNKDDEDNNFIGENACKNVKLKISKFFDKDKIIIKLPTKKDFGEMSVEEIREWYEY